MHDDVDDAVEEIAVVGDDEQVPGSASASLPAR
jgi:hypothetical protein